jgi:hypothetical protein
MKWKRERDLLISQTMAFVQSVAGKTTEAEGREAEGRTESIPLDKLAAMERPAETGAIARPSPVRHSELREEIRGRVAAFRAHQELFNRNRNQYCDSVLAKVRASTENRSTAPGDQPAKH